MFGVQSERQSFWDQVDMNNGVIPSGMLFTKAEDVLNLELNLRAAVKRWNQSMRATWGVRVRFVDVLVQFEDGAGNKASNRMKNGALLSRG